MHAQTHSHAYNVQYVMLENEAKSQVNHAINVNHVNQSFNRQKEQIYETKDRKNLEHRLDSEKIEQK